MRTITIRELHLRTGELVRELSRHGEIRVTRHGRVVAKLVPETEPVEVPYFARRRLSAAFRRLDESGKTSAGTDATATISEDREDRA
jgi:prevent-host-death family protein